MAGVTSLSQFGWLNFRRELTRGLVGPGRVMIKVEEEDRDTRPPYRPDF